MAYYYDEYFKPSRPREAKGGIRAQSTRGGFGESWWARRWVEVLEDLDLGARLTRGRSYARRGQVLSIDVEKGAVTAQVQGSRTRPYRVEIRVERLWGSDWEKLTSALSQRPVFAAKLLAGQMPETIEDVFTDVGLSLFPDRSDDLETDCSCPDWSNPCKHVAAVYLLLGEEFDRDPFLIFKLRGAEREELVGAAAESGIRADEATIEASDEGANRSPPEPLPVDLVEFWGQENAEREEDVHGAARIPTVSAVLPKRLGGFPFWRGKESLVLVLEEIYRRASPAGLDVFLGERRNHSD
ncbi:MAG: SWIM zinc finger family protein [Chloroflexi bacterium]|nr:SWIM zinc finger family protein [Chloroflexota bacterium]